MSISISFLLSFPFFLSFFLSLNEMQINVSHENVDEIIEILLYRNSIFSSSLQLVLNILISDEEKEERKQEHRS